MSASALDEPNVPAARRESLPPFPVALEADAGAAAMSVATELARLEGKVQRLERTLGDALSELAHERATRSELELADHAKDRFLAVLSHDLRAPLNAVLGWAQMLRRERLDSAARDRGLETIERNARTQLALVEEVLDLTRVRADKLRLEVEVTDLGALVRESVESAAPAARDRGVVLALADVTYDTTVLGDVKRLRQIVANLLTNAIKSTNTGGRVDVTLSSNGLEVELTVQDTGVGISRDALPRIFECFEQASEHPSTSGGLGLGLYIVRRLVELHGGTVSASSEGPARGASFLVRLPLHEASPSVREIAVASLAPATELEGLRILVVDDDVDARDLLSTLLRRHGADVALAPDARTAAGIFDAWAPDVVLSDLGLPGDDGYALVRRLRERGPLVPLVAVSGYAGSSHVSEALAAGFDFFVTKPFDVALLLEGLQRLGRTVRRPPLAPEHGT